MKRHQLTPELLIKLKKWWRIYLLIENDYWEQIKETEKKMAKDTGIKDIEFFHPNSELAVGIGNLERTIPLIHDTELET